MKPLTKEQKLNAIWKDTHNDYKGSVAGIKCILVFRQGTQLVPIEDLTEAEIEGRLKLIKK